jgi:polyisoprenoid-binding protein YceI
MNKTLMLITGAVLVIIALAGGIWLYNFVLGTTEAASAPISAPTLEIVASSTMAATPTSPPTQAAPSQAAITEATPVNLATTLAPAVTQNDPSAAAPSSLATYKISQEESQVRFNIFEQLRGQPKDVIGTSNQIAGEVAVDVNDLSSAQIGEILINARTLATDDDRRNQAIRNRILFTDQYEFIRFQPTQISGLNGSAAPGQSFTFQVTGDLTIKDVTKPVTFDVTMTLESPDRLTGSAKASIARADFNLNVPSVPFVANVGETMTLETDFVLTPS